MVRGGGPTHDRPHVTPPVTMTVAFFLENQFIPNLDSPHTGSRAFRGTSTIIHDDDRLLHEWATTTTNPVSVCHCPEKSIHDLGKRNGKGKATKATEPTL